MMRVHGYPVALAVIVSLAPFMIPDDAGGRLFSWGTLTLPDPGLPIPGGDDAGLPGDAAPASATAYEWRDAAGRWHYGDEPPAGVPAQQLVLLPDDNVVPAPEARQSEVLVPDPDASAASVRCRPLQQAHEAAKASARRIHRLDDAIEQHDAGH